MVSRATQVATATPKKAVKAKVGASKPSHPKTADLVLEAVTKLNEKGGTSLQAIKKYLADVHKVDVGRMGTFINKAVKNLTTNWKLSQTKGHGASGSFKLAVKPKAAAPKKVKKSPSKKPAKPKAAAVKKSPAKAVTTTKKVAAKKPKASKPSVPEPPVESKKAPVAKKPTAVKKTKTATKIKLPKTLKVKAASKPSSPKKSAPKKK